MVERKKTGLAAGAAWINGTVMPIAEARLPINDWGIIHSDITYDVVPVWDGGFFRLHDYIGRFLSSGLMLMFVLYRYPSSCRLMSYSCRRLAVACSQSPASMKRFSPMAQLGQLLRR